MFDGHVQWVAGFTDNYYEVTDRSGHIFRFMSWTDIDDWAPCGPSSSHGGWAYGQQDSSIRVGGSDDDDRGVKLTGRFWFDTRELGKDTSGSYNRDCYPNYYPDGTSMTDHLHQYYGKYLYPLSVRYNAGLLGLANRRVTVRTADATQANAFSCGRMDNYGNGPSFDAGTSGRHLYFVAKSPVTLTAPITNMAGRVFVMWLRDGASFGGNTSRTILINGQTLPIPATGTTYTAVYEAETRIIRIDGNLTFGNVTTGLTRTATTTIYNDGNSPLSVSNITFPPAFSGDWSAGTIARNASRSLAVTFTPTSVLLYAGNIIVDCDSTSGTNRCACSGTGIPPPCLVFLPTRGNQLVLSWGTNWSQFALEACTNLDAHPQWIEVSPAATVNGPVLTVSNTISGPRKFFRLRSL
jgi:hypothetical protein